MTDSTDTAPATATDGGGVRHAGDRPRRPPRARRSRARPAPTRTRTDERRRRPTGTARTTREGGEPAGRRKPSVQRLEEEGDVAADYLEELLDILDLDGDIDIDVENGRAAVSVVADPGSERALKRLVGSDGEVLEALQELTRLAVQTQHRRAHPADARRRRPPRRPARGAGEGRRRPPSSRCAPVARR